MAGDTEETGINQENENHPDSFNSEDNQNRFGAGWVKEYPDSKQNDLETEYIPVDTMDPEKLAIPQKENSSNHPLIDKLKVETENNIVKNKEEIVNNEQALKILKETKSLQVDESNIKEEVNEKELPQNEEIQQYPYDDLPLIDLTPYVEQSRYFRDPKETPETSQNPHKEDILNTEEVKEKDMEETVQPTEETQEPTTVSQEEDNLPDEEGEETPVPFWIKETVQPSEEKQEPSLITQQGGNLEESSEEDVLIEPVVSTEEKQEQTSITEEGVKEILTKEMKEFEEKFEKRIKHIETNVNQMDEKIKVIEARINGRLEVIVRQVEKLSDYNNDLYNLFLTFVESLTQDNDAIRSKMDELELKYTLLSQNQTPGGSQASNQSGHGQPSTPGQPQQNWKQEYSEIVINKLGAFRNIRPSKMTIDDKIKWHDLNKRKLEIEKNNFTAQEKRDEEKIVEKRKNREKLIRLLGTASVVGLAFTPMGIPALIGASLGGNIWLKGLGDAKGYGYFVDRYNEKAKAYRHGDTTQMSTIDIDEIEKWERRYNTIRAFLRGFTLNWSKFNNP